MTTLRTAAAALLLAAMLSPAFAAPRVYLAGGLGCPLFTGGLYQIAAKLAARGLRASVGCNFADALASARSGDVLIGHSYGALHAADAARTLRRRGIRVRVIALDPLWTPNAGATCAGVVRCICFYGQGLPMPAAKNAFVASSYGHIAYASDPRVQARVIAAVGR